nr:immunoglobulin heavy chain junction region [Macaca mulatta]MOY23104.1 immunoglobulin heavy chain junction region [Macaca mulatta]MOY27729.1 immunoglobulin heavy chain junction region [Macaca mulatta]MOY28191.1 immunoglobulin heavy chain junction region [Macaca mulatta]MOY28407.1 immunoglobulin heavy chain junction region [Macaca mulatta]
CATAHCSDSDCSSLRYW